MPLPSSPHRPFVLTFVGTAGAVEEGVGVGVGVVGEGVGVGLVDEETGMAEELERGTGTEDEGIGDELHDPKALLHPSPQKFRPVPQK